MTLKEKIKQAEKTLHEAHKALWTLKNSCKHETTKRYHESVMCDICGKGFGWWCPSSPDNACHYFSENGKVGLIDGTLVDVPSDHDCEYETDDNCMFCHDPDERK